MESSRPVEQAVEPMEVETPVIENASSVRSNFRISAILVALYLSLFAAALDQTVVSTAIPTIVSQLHSASGYTWIGGAYVLAKAAAMPIWAKLSDIWGRKPIILISLFFFFASSILCALARTMTALIAGRAIQGIGGGGLLQLIIITIADLFSLRKRSLFLSLADIMWAVAAGVGPVLGGAIVEFVSWRWIFWINLPITGTAFVLILLFLDVHNPRTRMAEGLRAVDWFGTITMLGVVLMLLLGLNFGGVVAAWSSAKVICLIVISVLMSVFFIVSEKWLAEYPIIPMRLFTERSNVAAFTVSIVGGFVFIAHEYYLPLYFQAAKLASPTRSGLLILPLILMEALSSFASGVVINRTGEYRQMLQVGMAIMTLGTGLSTLFRPETTIATVTGLQVLTGFGVGLCFQPPVLAIHALVPQQDVATATGTLSFLKNLATALSIVIGGVVFQNSIDMRKDNLLEAGLDAMLAQELAGPDAAANVELIGKIEDERQQSAVREAFAWGLRNMWIMYACMAACGVVATFFIKRSVLRKEHTETKTGLKKEQNEPVVTG